MIKALLLVASASVATAGPALAQDYRFDFSGTVLAGTTPATVTPQSISGYLTYVDTMSPADGNVTTAMGQATLYTNLYSPLMFTGYNATLSDQMFSFAGTSTSGSNFSLHVSALPGGGYGYTGDDDGFALTGPSETAVGNVSGTFETTPSDPPAAVPEPAAWLMMIVGIGAVGVTLRRARVTTKVSYS